MCYSTKETPALVPYGGDPVPVRLSRVPMLFVAFLGRIFSKIRLAMFRATQCRLVTSAYSSDNFAKQCWAIRGAVVGRFWSEIARFRGECIAGLVSHKGREAIRPNSKSGKTKQSAASLRHIVACAMIDMIALPAAVGEFFPYLTQRL